MRDNEQFIMMPVPASMFTAVCAVLGGVALAARTTEPQRVTVPKGNDATTDAAPTPAVSLSASDAEASPAAATADGANAPADGEVDAHGHSWSADLHASTRGKTKDGLWRMKVGVSRPDALPGFPLQASASQSGAAAGATGTSENGAASEPSASATTEAAPSPAATEEDDEFAAFRAAAENSNAKDAAAAEAVPARKWTDADLGALCNQAATKLGDPSPIKAIIADYIPDGQVAHSRNIPDEQRAAFAAAVEAKAGIEFAG